MKILPTIATRFAIKKWGGPTDEWLRYRFDVFEQYTLPSVLNQTRTDFVWFLMYSLIIPDWAIERLMGYMRDDERIQPVEIPEDKYPHHILPYEVAERYEKDTTHYYQLRLDSDDLIMTDFLEYSVNVLSKAIKDKDSLWLSMPNGYVTDGVCFDEFGWKDNSFVGVLAKKRHLTSAYADAHPKIRKPKYDVMESTLVRSWAHMRHEMNKSKGPKVSKNGPNLRAQFGIL